jgi:flagellin-specific chaperone FliS
VTRKRQPPEVSIVRSSAAEYLTFVVATGSQQQAVEMRYEDENIWLSQKMMATSRPSTSTSNVSVRRTASIISKIYAVAVSTEF